jgi:hypothetical protein
MSGKAKPLLLLILIWLVPLVFVSLGYWPFGLLIAIGATLWFYLDRRDRRR